MSSSSSLTSNNASYQVNDETILQCIVPIRSFKKQMIIKILLSCPNRLILIETLKLMICILRRYQQYQIEMKGSGIAGTNHHHHQLSTLLYQQLPYWNVLIRTYPDLIIVHQLLLQQMIAVTKIMMTTKL